MPPGVRTGREVLPGYLQTYSSPEYKANTVMLYGAQWENSDLFPQQATIVEDWNKVYAYPQLAYSDFASALQEIADQLGDSIPVIKGDGGPYWEDGIYSDTQNAILAREAEQRAPSAEKLSTLSSLIHPYVQMERAALDRMWQNLLLFDEHTWGAWQSISSPESKETVRQQTVKDAFATQAEQDLDYILERGMAAISDYINDPKGTLVVFNTLNWQRSGLVEVDLLKGSELVDLVSGNAVPYQVVSDLPAFPIRARASLPSSAFALSPKTCRLWVIGAIQSRPSALEARSGSGGREAGDDPGKQLLPCRLRCGKRRGEEYLRQGIEEGAGEHREPLSLRRVSLRQWRRQAAPQPPDFCVARSCRLLNLPFMGATVDGLFPLNALRLAPLRTWKVRTSIRPKCRRMSFCLTPRRRLNSLTTCRRKRSTPRKLSTLPFPLPADNPQIRYDLQNGFVDPTRDLLPVRRENGFRFSTGQRFNRVM